MKDTPAPSTSSLAAAAATSLPSAPASEKKAAATPQKEAKGSAAPPPDAAASKTPGVGVTWLQLLTAAALRTRLLRVITAIAFAYAVMAQLLDVSPAAGLPPPALLLLLIEVRGAAWQQHPQHGRFLVH